MTLRKPAKPGIRIRGWIEYAEPIGSGFRHRRRQPAQGRVRGADVSVRGEATFSPQEAQTRGTLRAYLERSEADPVVVQQALLEDWLDRWGIWIRPSEPDADPAVVTSVLKEELERRYGIDPRDVFIVRHTSTDKDGQPHYHYHAVVPAWVIENEETGAARKVEITRDDMTAIAKELARELLLERQLDRALEPKQESGAGTVGGRWDMPPTDTQMSMLRAHGKAARDITRGEASLVIEEITGTRSWYAGRDRGMDR
jgi:hypothetical protein